SGVAASPNRFLPVADSWRYSTESTLRRRRESSPCWSGRLVVARRPSSRSSPASSAPRLEWLRRAAYQSTQLADAEKVAFRRRAVGFVFQQYNLLPALTAAENAAIPLVAAGVPLRAA